jgi:ABC-type transport system involved in multi-copper enzyme maturation permease subunit
MRNGEDPGLARTAFAAAPRRAAGRVRPLKEKPPPLGQGLFPLLDPLTIKELNGMSRHWQNYAGRVLQVGIVACVLLRWWSDLMSHPGRFSNSDYAVFGRTLFQAFVPGQLVLITLAAISAGSDMITKELRSGTLGLLDLASLSAGQIAASKWKAVMVSATSLLLCGLPVMATCVYLGGVGPWELAWSASSTWVVAALGAAFSIRCSAICHSPLTAILKSAAVILGSTLLLVPLFIIGKLFGFSACLVHPVYSALAATEGRPGDGQVLGWICSTAFSLGFMLVLLRSAAVLVRKRVVNPPPTPRPLNDPELFEENYQRLTLNGPRLLTVRRRIWDRHELLWKEWTTRPATRVPRDARIVIGVVLAFLVWIVWECSYEGRSSGPFFFLGMLFLVLVTINGAVLFGSERDGLKLDMLLSTPLSTRRIVFTKLIAGLCSPESLAGIAFLAGALGGWYSGAGWAGFCAAALSSFLFLLFGYALGVAASLYSKSVRSAVLISCTVVGFLVVGVPWIAATLFPLGQNGAWSTLGQIVNALGVAGVLEQYRTTVEQRATGYRVDLGDALRMCAPFCLLYAGLILVLMASIFRRFRRITGRS